MKTDLKSWRWTRLVLVVTLTTALVQPVLADAGIASEALDQVPNDMQLLVMVPNLADACNKLIMLDEKLGLGLLQLTNVLDQFKEKTGLTQGLKDNGPVMIVFSDLATATIGAKAPYVMVAPTTDYAALVTNNGGHPDGITEFTKRNGQSNYAKASGHYAVIGPDRAAVEAYQAGNASANYLSMVGSLGADCLAKSDAVVVVNFQSLAPTIRQQLTVAMQTLEEELIVSTPNPQSSLAVAAIFNDSINALVRDTQALVIAVDLTEQGAGFSFIGQFKKNSYVASLFEKSGAANRYLALLPDRPYIFANCFDMSGIAVDELIDHLLARLPQNIGDFSFLFDIYKESLLTAAQIKGGATIWYVPKQSPLMGGGFNTLTVYEVEDGPGYLAKWKKSIEKLDNMTAPLDGEQDQLDLNMTTQYTPAVIEIDGIKIDQYQFQINISPDLMTKIGQVNPIFVQLMQVFTNYQGYITAKDNHVILTTTIDEQLMREAFVQCDNSTGLGSTGPIAAMRHNLTASPMGEFYVSIGGIVDTAAILLAILGIPLPPAPADLPPAAISISFQNNGGIDRLFVPMETLQYVSTLAEQYAPMLGAGPSVTPSRRQDRDSPPPAPF